MVGTRFICAVNGKLQPQANLISAPPDSGIASQPWEARTVWSKEWCCLDYLKYDAYPITCFETPEFLIYLEGRLYGLDNSGLELELLHLAHCAFSPGYQTTSLKNWLRDTDGDFLIFILHKKADTFVVINDLFARLPVYYSFDGETFVISRGIQYVWQKTPNSRLDPMSLTQYLVFGFPLGPRTFFEGIYSLPPASLITLDRQHSQATVHRLFQHNLEALRPPSGSVHVNAGHLVDLFREGCVNRAAITGKNIVSLSGGLDSRAVAGCLGRKNLPVAAATFLDHEAGNITDFRVAGQVAAHLNLPWHTFHLAPPREQEIRTLLRLKQGANNLEMGFILAFLHGLLRTFGAGLIYFTGDGGGDTLGESRPYRRVSSPASLVRYLIERYQIFPLHLATSLTGIAARDLEEVLADLLDSYPEQTMTRKYQHFFCLEVAVRQYNEGEDRNRQYFWSVSPFYAPRFFEYALSCPDDQKFALHLYRQFLGRLSPGLENLPYADWGAPLGSLKFALLYAAKNLSRMRPQLTRSMKRFFHSSPNHSSLFYPAQALKKQVATCPGLAANFSGAVLKNLAGNIDTLSIGQQWTLFTLTSLIEELSARQNGIPGAEQGSEVPAFSRSPRPNSTKGLGEGI
jgi:asparagine synthase (glutamine-hydrolysing)